MGPGDGGHVNHAIVRAAVARTKRREGGDDLAELRQVGDNGAASGDSGPARVDVHYLVALFKEMLDDPDASFAAAAGDENAFGSHGRERSRSNSRTGCVHV